MKIKKKPVEVIEQAQEQEPVKTVAQPVKKEPVTKKAGSHQISFRISMPIYEALLNRVENKAESDPFSKWSINNEVNSLLYAQLKALGEL